MTQFSELAARAKAQAYGLGFDLAGIAMLGAADTAPEFRRWLAAGMHGEMGYLDRGADLRDDTTRPEPHMRSAIVVALDYGARQPSGPVARYARGEDYHDVMRSRLRLLHEWIQAQAGTSVPGRPFVDTGPILERDLARRAGLGWFGKNTMLINPRMGSFFFIGALFLGIDLEPDEPFGEDHCGTCTRCLDACPTGAITAPRVLDATRCISYLTIEHRSAIPAELRPLMGDLVYGCDVCQDVCPWNLRFGREPRDGPLAPRTDRVAPPLAAWLRLDDEGFRRTFRGSAMTRAKRRGLARNIAVAMGSARREEHAAPLAEALRDDPEPLVRAHAAWALGRMAHVADARDALHSARGNERDSGVLAEIDAALEDAG